MSEITLKNISVTPPKTKVKRSLASRGRLKLGNTVSQTSTSPAVDQFANRPSKILTVGVPAKELTLVVNGVRESISISPDRSARKRSTILKIPLEGRRFSSVGNHLNGLHKLQANTPELKKTAEDPQDFKSLTFMRGLVNNWRRNLDDLTNEELTELAIFSLKKDPETRAIQDTNVLTQYLSEIAFFQTFEKSLLEQFVQHFHHLFLPKGTTVFRMDDSGTNMYVLLKGSVGIWSHKGAEEASDQNKKELLRKSMIETKVLSSGAIFGEHTFTNNSTRPYTIICKESCQVAVFEKQDYLNVLAQNKAEKLAEEIKFLGSIPLFKFFTERTLKMFASILPTEKYLRGHKVYQEADEPQSMYIVKKGEFKMLKSVVEGKGENKSGKRESISKLKITQKKRKNIEICLIGEHEMFGEDELVQEIPRFYTIICNSTEAEVYRIDKKILFEKIFKSSSTSKWLKGYSEWKAKYYEDRIKTLSTPAGVNQNMGDNYDSRDYSSNNGYESLPKPAHIRNMSEALIQGFDPSVTASPKADRSLKLSMEVSKKSPGLDSPKVRIDGIEIENSFIAMNARRNPSTPYERRFNKNQSNNDPSSDNSQNSEAKKKEEESRKVPNFKSFSDRYNISAGAVRAGLDSLFSDRKSPETNNPFQAFRGLLTNDALEKSASRPKTERGEMGRNFPSKKLDKLPSSDEKTDNSPHFQDILKELRGDKSNKSIFTAANFGFTQTSNKAASVPVRQNSANILGNRNIVPQQAIITPILSPRHQHSIIAYNKAVVGSNRESANISCEFSKQAPHEVQNIHMSKLRSSKSAKSLRPFGKTSLDLKKKKVVDLMKISQINNFYEKPNLFNTPIIPAFGFQGSQTTKRPNSKGFLSERQLRIPIDEVNEEDRNFSITNRQWERGY